MDCIFCTLQTVEAVKKLYENNEWYVLPDKFPVTKGHAICILKKHKESFFQLEDSEVISLKDALTKSKARIDAAHAPKAYNIGVNDGREAGRTIDHIHVHIVPRYGTEKGVIRELANLEENLDRQGKTKEHPKD